MLKLNYSQKYGLLSPHALSWCSRSFNLVVYCYCTLRV